MIGTRRGLVPALVLALAGAAAVFAATGTGTSAAADAVTRGREIYRARCLECHGETGKGDGKTAVKLKLTPRDMTRGSYKCRSTASGELPADADLARSVARGLPGSAMTAFGELLAPDEIAAVVAYVRTLSPRFAAEPAPICLAVPEPPASSPERIERGQQIYRLLQCFTCHGKAGMADGKAAAGLAEDSGARVKPLRFAGGKLKCGGEAQDLYRTIHTGLNGGPMPAYADALAFTREAKDGLATVASEFGPEAAAAVSAYLDREPDATAWAALSDDARQRAIAERTWALVFYLRSLIEAH
jgi:cytochrome c oxidase cbb3-type subunit 2